LAAIVLEASRPATRVTPQERFRHGGQAGEGDGIVESRHKTLASRASAV
jgi:hypothetical protein